MNGNEQKMKEIARDTFMECFKGFSDQLSNQSDQLVNQSNDIKEIKNCIVGDEYHPEGLSIRVTKLEAYVEENKSTKVAERGLKVIKWWEDLSKKKGSDGRSELQILEDGISGIESIKNFKKVATFLGFTNIGTLLAIILQQIIK